MNDIQVFDNISRIMIKFEHFANFRAHKKTRKKMNFKNLKA